MCPHESHRTMFDIAVPKALVVGISPSARSTSAATVK
jgi:hypothetical protein